MKKLILSLVILISAQMIYAQQTLKEGVAMLESDNISSARKVFQGILKQDPKNAGAWFYLGEIFRADDNVDSAAFYYSKALAANPDSYFAHIGTATLLLDKNKTVEAEKAFGKAKKSVRSKELPEVLGLIGNAYLKARYPNYEKSAAAYLEARDLDNKTARYFVGYGDALLAQGKIGEALNNYELASNKDKDNPEILMKIARTYYKNGIVDVAIGQLEAGIAKFPNYGPAYKDLYELYFGKGLYAKGTPLLEKYVTLVGSDVEQRARLVKFLTFQAKDYSKAIAEANIVLQQQPNNYSMYRWIAWAQFEAGDYQASFDASKRFFEMVETRPVYASDYEYYAKAASKLNNPVLAVENYRKVAELDTTRTDVLDLIAKAYYDAKQWPEAEAAYSEKLLKSLQPTSQDWFFLGISRYQQAKYAEADSAFIKLTEIQPTYATGWYYRAKSNDRLDTDRANFLAQPYYAKYIELAEVDPEKYKKQLVEAYNYAGHYSYDKVDDVNAAIAWYEKSLALDPTNEETKSILDQLKEAAKGGK